MKFTNYILREQMKEWSKKQRETELALSTPERIKVIEKKFSSLVFKYKHPNNLEDLRFYKKFKPGSFWKKVDNAVTQEHHPSSAEQVMKFLKKNIK